MKQITKKNFIGYCANGAKVFNRTDGHNDVHPVDEELLKEAFLKISPCEDFIKKEISFNRLIGKNTCVNVDKTDTIIMAYRKGRLGPTPMVLNRVPEDCYTLVVVMRKIGDNEYSLRTTFIGKKAEREPWDSIQDPEEFQRAKAFWSTHALIYDENIVEKIA